MIRVTLPAHLSTIARVEGEVRLEAGDRATIRSVLDALEERFPALRGTIRDHGTRKRRAFLRYFVCGEDWSLEPEDRPLPATVLEGREPFMVIGSIAGG